MVTTMQPASETDVTMTQDDSTPADRTETIGHLFEECLDPVYRFLYSRVGNREDAEDLTSEVFVKAAHLLNPERAEHSKLAWLYTVARTVLADHWRRYYRTGPLQPLDDLPEGLLADTQPEGGSGEHEDQVAALLQQLPDRHRRVLELRFLRGYSLRETAQELAITTANVKVLQHRALAKAAGLEIALTLPGSTRSPGPALAGGHAPPPPSGPVPPERQTTPACSS